MVGRNFFLILIKRPKTYLCENDPKNMSEKSTSDVIDFEYNRNKRYTILIAGAVLATMLYYIVFKPLLGID